MKLPDDVLDIIGNAPTMYVVLYEENFTKDYFDLSTRKLGEVLQKLTNHRVKLAIIGDFEKFTSKSLHAFIYETNRHGEYLFVPSIDKAKKIWTNLL